MINTDFPFLCKEEIEIYDEEVSRVYFPSRYNFLRSHTGFKKGNMHMFLGTSGGGKSTLMRSLILDIMQSFTEKSDFLLVWLSEEKSKDYYRELYKTGIPYELLKKIRIYSEVDDSQKGSKDILKKMEWLINEKKPKAFVYDNLTTSMEYASKAPAQQDVFYGQLKTLCISTEIPFIITAHTNGKIGESYEGLIEQEDIRGSKMPPMMSEFFYIMQSFYSGDARFNTIKITKFRGNPVSHRLYEINYEPEMRIFNADKKLNFDAFKKVFKTRNKIK